MLKYAIIDINTGKVCVKSNSEDIIRQCWPAYSRGWGYMSGFKMTTFIEGITTMQTQQTPIEEKKHTIIE